MRSLRPQLWPNNEHWWLWVPDRARCARLSGTTWMECGATILDSIFKQPILRPSLRGANGSRECAPDDRLHDEAIHSSFARRNGLLRFARNDVAPISDTTPRSRGAMRPSFAR